jgi:hypothetical protein
MLKPAKYSPLLSLTASCKMMRLGWSITALGLLTNGCALWQPLQAPSSASAAPLGTLASATTLPAVLSEAATTALGKARLEVADAKRSRSLWKSAADKLTAAELAATNQDSANTLRLSNEIILLCELSRAQLLHPAVIW